MTANGFDFDAYTSLGAILVRLGHMTKNQLDRAVKAQKNGHSGMLLGEIVVKLGFCTEAAVTEAIVHQNAVRPREAKSDAALERLWVATANADQSAKRLKKTTTRKIRILDISSGQEK